MLAERVRAAREAKGWTRYRLTKEAELKGSHVAWLEDGNGDAKGDTLLKLATALDVTVDGLLGGDTGGPPARESEADPDPTDTPAA
jgi:transcriptional regulator with XRE-family HTH domain